MSHTYKLDGNGRVGLERVCYPLLTVTGEWVVPRSSLLLIKVGLDDATLLLGTRGSVPLEHCSTLPQGVASAFNNVG